MAYSGDPEALLVRACNNDPDFKCLVLKNNVARAQLVAEALPTNTNLKSLLLDENDFEADDIETILDSLHPEASIATLALSNTRLNLEGMQHLAAYLKTDPSIERLDISNNPLIGADGCKVLASALEHNTRLRVLDLSQVNVLDEGIEHLAAALKNENCGLETLLVSYNHITNKGAQALVDMLNSNMSLLAIRMWGNQMAKRIAEEMEKGLAKNKELAQERQAHSDVSDEVVNTGEGGLALQGYDPVAYFMNKGAMIGDPTITATCKGALYNFASIKHRDLFVKNPTKYAPAFGGYCGYALAAANALVPITPTAFTIIENRLVLQHTDEALGAWNEDPKGCMVKANANWPNHNKVDTKDVTPRVQENTEDGSQEQHGQNELVNVGEGGLAIQGYDPVAYFVSDTAVLGDPTINATYKGAVYNFSSVEHRDLFVENPPKYAPAFGGYCGYGLGAANALAPITPTVFTIIEDRLVLQHTAESFELWKEDPEGFMAKAVANWPNHNRVDKDSNPASLEDTEDGLQSSENDCKPMKSAARQHVADGSEDLENKDNSEETADGPAMAEGIEIEPLPHPHHHRHFLTSLVVKEWETMANTMSTIASDKGDAGTIDTEEVAEESEPKDATTA